MERYFAILHKFVTTDIDNFAFNILDLTLIKLKTKETLDKCADAFWEKGGGESEIILQNNVEDGLSQKDPKSEIFTAETETS